MSTTTEAPAMSREEQIEAAAQIVDGADFPTDLGHAIAQNIRALVTRNKSARLINEAQAELERLADEPPPLPFTGEKLKLKTQSDLAREIAQLIEFYQAKISYETASTTISQRSRLQNRIKQLTADLIDSACPTIAVKIDERKQRVSILQRRIAHWSAMLAEVDVIRQLESDLARWASTGLTDDEKVRFPKNPYEQMPGQLPGMQGEQKTAERRRNVERLAKVQRVARVRLEALKSRADVHKHAQAETTKSQRESRKLVGELEELRQQQLDWTSIPWEGTPHPYGSSP
ncbi:MAG: hypothetical protein ACYTG0_25920 [Planctomycetota bacterium]|jgi:chaperonin cofactor prefoldin